MARFINYILFITFAGFPAACSSEEFILLGQFMGSPSAIEAIAPSSEELLELMTETIDPEHSVVIEL